MTKLTGETPLTIDGRDYVLVLDHEALIEAEAAHGVPLPLVLAQSSLGFVGATAALLFGALRAHHADVSLKDARRLVLENQDACGAAMELAAKAAFPEKAEGKQKADPPKAPGAKRARTGKRSGGNGVKQASSRKTSSARPRASSRSSSARG